MSTVGPTIVAIMVALRWLQLGSIVLGPYCFFMQPLLQQIVVLNLSAKFESMIVTIADNGQA